EGYGHEDTLWGQQLAKAGVGILHIDNPVTHLGLETSGVFLEKQHRAIHNLRLLKKQTPHLRTRLIDLAEKYPRLTQLARYLPEKTLLHLLQKNRFAWFSPTLWLPPQRSGLGRVGGEVKKRASLSLYLLDLLKLKWWQDA
ncbi:MAG: hypothetical protein AAGA62_13425, partial [Bacteroidota bacterium]